jgi:hypothetical protein
VLLGLSVAVAVGAVAASVAGSGPSLPVQSGARKSGLVPLDERPAPTDRMPFSIRLQARKGKGGRK